MTTSTKNGRSQEATEADIPPQDLVAETCVLGAVLLSKGGVIADVLTAGLTPQRFHQPQNGRIFATCCDMASHGVPIDAVTLAEALHQRAILGDVGGVPRIDELLESVPHTAHAKYYARQVVDQARRRDAIDIGRRLIQSANDPTIAVEGLVDEIERFSEVQRSGGEGLEPKDEFNVFTAAELDAAEFPQNDLIEGVLVEGQPCIVAAPKKSLKTNIMCDAALSLASRCRFLGEFYIPNRKRTALISGESGEATIQETARRIAKTKQWFNLRDYTDAVFGFNLPNFGNDKSMRALRRFIKDFRIEVLIVDPAYLCLPLGDDAGNLFKVGSILMPFSRLARDENITPIIVHHFVKSSAVTESPPELENIAWAGFQEWARQWILLSRRSRYDADKPGHHELWFACGGSAGHSVAKALDIEEGSRTDTGGRRWEVVVQNPAEARQGQADEREKLKSERESQTQNREREKALEAFRLFPNGETKTTIRNSAGMSGEKFGPVLAELLKSGEVVACNINKNGRPIEGFRLKSADTGTNGTSPGLTGTNSSCPTERAGPGHPPFIKGCPCPTAHPESLFPAERDNSAICPGGVAATESQDPRGAPA